MMKKILLLAIMMVSLNLMAQQSHYWTPMTGNQYNMTVRGVIVIDDVQQSSTQLEIGAFCEEECRASTFAQLFPPTGEYIVTMTIRSNIEPGTTEVIYFKLYDHVAGEELNLTCVNTIDFVINGSVGTLNNWFQFAFTSSQHNNAPGNWSDPTIWGGNVPEEGATVVIEYNCTIDEDAEVGDLTIATGAQLTVASGNTLIVDGELLNENDDVDGLIIKDMAQVVNSTSGVKATVEKDITQYSTRDVDGWYLISSSVDEMDIAGSDFLTEIFDLYRYNEEGALWQNYRQNYSDFTTFENGRGYLFANSNTFSPAFKGELNATDVSTYVTCLNTGTLSGWNVIGNPFPHDIYKGDGGAIDDVNLATGYYILTFEGGWMPKTYDDAISPETGILVKTTATKYVNITKTAVPAVNESGAKGDAQRLQFTVMGDNGEDCAYVYFCPGIGLDKMSNFSQSIPTIAFRNNGADYAIAHVDMETEACIMVFNTTVPGEFTLKVDNSKADFDYLHLIDKISGDDIDLLMESEYRFNATGNEYEDRFIIVYRNTTGVDENYENATFAYVSNGDITVNGNGTLQVFDVTGKCVMNAEVNGVTTLNAMSQGVYVFRLVEENSVKTQKIAIR